MIPVTSGFMVSPLFEIYNDDFTTWYSRGVFWAMYGDEQGKGPYADTYLIENIDRNLLAGRYDALFSSELPSIGFYWGALHGGWLSKPGDTLVVLTDPHFTSAYHEGRAHPVRLNDAGMMRLFNTHAHEGTPLPGLRRSLGLLTGIMSLALIPATAAV
jgi:hypothetical protein